MAAIHAIVMAGGSGTRFWPASRRSRPKQVLPLAHGTTLIEATVARLAGLCDPEHVWIVTNAPLQKALGRQLLDFPVRQILVEPEPRDTAPGVAFATAAIAARDPEATMVVLPADHLIEPVDEFQRMIVRAAAIAADGHTLVTFGVTPTHAATGFGYLECGERLDGAEPTAFRVASFREKPDAATAARFVGQGGFLWNSGIFVWQVAAIRKAMAATAPELAEATDRMVAAMTAGNRAQVTRAFKRTPATSIDYAVMERASSVAVVRFTARWSDVGSFDALGAVGDVDPTGNIAVLPFGASQVAVESRNNVVYAEGRRTVALFGVDDLIVCAVGDAVLVCPRRRAADLKVLVDHLRAAGRTDLL